MVFFPIFVITHNYKLDNKSDIALDNAERHRASQTFTDDKVSPFYRMDSEGGDISIPCDSNALSQCFSIFLKLQPFNTVPFIMVILNHKK